MNTADIDAWYQGINPTHSNWYGVKNAYATSNQEVDVPDTSQGHGLVAISNTISLIPSRAVHRNPCFIGESPTIPFKPTLLIGLLNKPGENDVIANPAMSLYVEADIAVSFRGLRKAPVVKYV
jgi:hypothetical protein